MFKDKTVFVTGTDTDVGKTICVKALLQAAGRQSLTTLAYKPIAAGCMVTSKGLRNDDALILQQSSTVTVPYQAVNPIAFKPPIAPHIAAELVNTPIEVDVITQGLKVLQDKKADLLIVEGAGGWRLPLNNEQLLSDWVKAQKLPVILVVGMKLGCLNHALLTYETIVNDGLNVVGWIANQLQPDMPYYEQNLHLLTKKLDAPLIAEIPYLSNVNNSDLAQYVNCDFS
ncbi:dethiobiotin synthase [Psychromonas aquimarina]|uniref:dethiobiotin synthase n=1 Tax=Psychromonas aquimarina TaxID=444919 RepID=UPI0004272DE9|nr:dethiobiotin synthase [Psychromonas aquimarina]